MSSKREQNLLSTFEAAKASGYTPAYISALCRSGELPSTRKGKAWMIKRSDLKSYLQKVEEEKKRLAEELAQKRKNEYWERQRQEQNLLSTVEAAKASGYTPAYISALCRSGELPSTRKGKAWVIKAADLEAHLVKVEEEKKRLAEELAEKRRSEYQEIQPVVRTRQISAYTYSVTYTYLRAVAVLLVSFAVVAVASSTLAPKSSENIADVHGVQGSTEVVAEDTLVAAAGSNTSPILAVGRAVASFTYEAIDTFFSTAERRVAAFFMPRTNVQFTVVGNPTLPVAPDPQPVVVSTTTFATTTNATNVENVTQYITQNITQRSVVEGVSMEFFALALSRFGDYLLRPVWLSFYALDDRFEDLDSRIDDIDVSGGSIGGDITGDSITISGNGSIGGTFEAGDTTINGGLTVDGDADITGTLTVGSFTVADLTVSNSITSPAFIAASSTATSTFAGPIQFTTATGNSLTATSSVFANLLATNATTTNATSTNLFASFFTATTGTIDTFTSALATITDALITNLTATNATLTNATTTNATSTNLTISNVLRLTGLTPSRLVFVDSAGIATSTDLSSWVTGTANQISVADNGAGGVTLSLPSNLALGNATATTFSANSASFGATGTTTISSTGALSTPSLTVGSLNGILRATGGAIATSLVSLTSDVEDVLPVASGGTGTGTAPVYGELLVGNGSGGYTLMATSSLGITSAEWGNITGTLSDQTDLQNALDSKLSLSAWFATTTDALAEGSNLYYTDARVSTLLDTYSKGYFFSTTSAAYWETQQTARTADDLTNNSIEDLSDVAAMTPNVNDFLTWNGSAWTNVATSSFGFVTGVAWGDITGTLSDQTDLQNALNAKFSLSDWYATTTHSGITSLPSLTTLGTITGGIWQGSAIAPAYLDPVVLLTTEVDTSAELAGILSDEVGSGSVVFSNAPTFTGVANFADIITTNATSTNLFVSGQTRLGTLDGLLRADAGVVSVATPGVDYLADASGDWTGTLDGFEGSYYLANSFSTSSADSWLSARNTDDLAEGSNLYYTDARVLSYVDSLGKGYFFSTTSANAWLGTKSTDDIAEGANLYYTLGRFASALAGTTTDALLEGSTNLYYTDARARAALSSTAAGLSYNSATGVLSLSSGYTIPLAASTTEWATAFAWGDHAAQNYFDLDLNDSDDIPEGGTNLFYSNSRVATYLDTVSKGYFFSTTSANYWETQQTARTADDLTNNSIEDLMDVGAMTKSWGNLLSWNGSAWTNVATSSLGLTPTFTATYPLQYSSNVLSLAFGTTTANTWGPLQTFNSGILAQASSTVVGDFTVTGTTHLDDISIAGDIIPTADNVYSLGSPSRMWRDVYIGPGSLYINGQKVLEEDATTDIVVTADPTQNLKIKTTDGGNIELNANATGQLIFKSNLNITGGKSIVTSDLSTLPIPNGVAAGNITVAGNTISATNLNGGVSLAGTGTGGVYITSGNFGVGTTSPFMKLSVAGNSFFGGNLTATGTVTFSSLGDGFVKSTGGVLSIAVPGVDYLDDTSGDWTGTFDGQEGSYYLANSFSTTSANYWETQQTARTADDLTNNSIEDLSDVASMTESFGNLLGWNGSAWTNIATSTLGIAFADITGTVSQSQGGTGITSYNPGDILYADNAGVLTTLPKGANGQVLKLSGGLPSWGSDITTGGGGGEGAWATTTDSLAIYTTDTSDAVIIGGSATTTANSIFEVFGTSYFSNTIGIATTSPSPLHKLAVQGNALFSGNITSAGLTATGTVTFSGLGSGLVKATSGVLSLATAGVDYVANTSGDWTGTFDGFEGSYYLANSFSTTSAAYWKEQNNFFSTTSTNAWFATKTTDNLAEGATNLFYTNARVLTYLDTLDKGYFFSTTSANFWKEQNNFFSTTSANVWLATKSTTDIAEGTNLYWTNTRFDNRLSATTTLPNLTTLANLATVGTITSGTWQGTAVADAYVSDALSISGGTINSTPIGATSPSTAIFTNATTTNATTTNLYASSAITLGSDRITDFTGTGLQLTGGALALNATGDWTGTFDGQEGSYYLANSFSTTSASYFLSQNQNAAFSTTSTNYWLSTKTTDNLAEGATNQYWTLNRFAAALAGTTTSALAEGTNLYYTDARARAAISESVTGLTYNNSTGVLTLTSGYEIPLTASTTNWNTFYNTPSTRITAGTNLSWSGNTLNGPTDSYIRSLLSAGSGLSYNSGTGVFSLDATGDWTGTFDGFEGSYYLANSFSTTSANVWLATKSTTDIAEGTNLYWTNTRFDNRLSATTTLPNLTTLANLATVGTITSGTWQGSAIAPTYLDSSVILSTEIDTYNELNTLVSDVTLTHNALIDTSSELAGILTDETGTSGGFVRAGSPTFSGTVSLANFTATNGTTTNATSTNLYISGQTRIASLTGLLKASSGVVTTAVAGTDYVANTSGDWTGTFDGFEGSYYLANSFSTTSANVWLGTKSTSNLAEGSNLYYTDARVGTYITSSTTLPAFLNYWTKSGSNLGYTAGNVGIGTSSPAAILDISGTGAIVPRITSTNGGGDSALRFYSGSTFKGSVGWDQADDTVGIYAAGSSATQALAISLSGDVGIGTTSPSQNLHVYGSTQTQALFQSTGTASYLMFADSGTSVTTNQGVGSIGNNLVLHAGGTTRATLTSTGNLGIGSTSPDSTLTVQASSNSTYNIHTVNGGGSAKGVWIQGGNTDSDASLLKVSNYDASSTYFEVTDGNSYFNGGNVGIGTSNPQSTLHVLASGTAGTPSSTSGTTAILQRSASAGTSSFLSIISGNASSAGINFGDTESDIMGRIAYDNALNGLTFRTNGTSDRMVINSSGNVGIGTTTPLAPLNVVGVGGDASITLGIQNAISKFTVGNTSLDIGRYNTTPFAHYLQVRNENNSNSRPLVLNPVDGNVGIGTTSPFAKLSVAGDAYIGGNLTATGTATIGSLTGIIKGTSGVLSAATLGADYINNSSIDTSAEIAAIVSGETGTGALVFGTNPYLTGATINSTTNTTPLVVGRNTGTDEALSVGVTDSATNFLYTNDEASGSIVFRINNTDTETGGGASANDVNVLTLVSTPTYSQATVSGRLSVSDSLTVGTLTGPLQAVAGVVSATSTMSVKYGGTGLSTAPSYGQMLVGNSSGGYTLMSTSSLNIAASSFSGTLGISQGGTNATSQTTNGVNYFDGTSITSGSNLTTDGASLTASGYVISGTQFQAPIGDASTPSYSWNLDPTTGIFNAGGSAIGFSLSGTEMMRLSADGYLGIGTTSPFTPLSVAGNGYFTGTLTASNLSGTNTGNVTLAGETYLSLSGQQITAADVNLTSHVTGVLPVANGGTGATSLSNLITLGTHTTGNYVASVTGGTAITVTGTAAEGWTPTISVTADSITDTQLQYNTGQHLTTTSSVAFNSVSVATQILDTDDSTLDVADSLAVQGYVEGLGLLSLERVTTPTVDTNIYDMNFGYTVKESGTGLKNNYFSYHGTDVKYGTYSSSEGFFTQGAYPRSHVLMQSTGSGGLAQLATTSPWRGGYHTEYFIGDYMTSVDRVQLTSANTHWVYGVTTGYDFEIGNDLFVTGSVGIGTTSPAQILHLSSASAFGTSLRIDNWDTGARQYRLISTGSSNTSGAGKFGILDEQTSAMRFVIDSNGNVGVGTTSPTGELHVFSSGNGDILAERSGGAQIAMSAQASTGQIGTISNHNLQLITNSTARLTVNTSGNVGIGTTSPASRLHVEGTNSSSGGLTISSSAGTATNRLAIYGDGNTSAAIQKLSSAGVLSFKNSTGGEEARFSTDGNFAIGTTTASARLSVQTTSTNDILNLFETGGAEVFTVLESGNIGIGASNPASKLTVIKDGAYNSEGNVGIRIMSAESSADVALHMGADATNDIGFIQAMQPGVAWTRSLVLQGNGGNVGIGTVSPAQKLEIEGDSARIRIDDAGGVQGFTAGLLSGGQGFLELDDATGVAKVLFRADTGDSYISNGGNVGIGTTTPAALLNLDKTYTATGESEMLRLTYRRTDVSDDIADGGYISMKVVDGNNGGDAFDHARISWANDGPGTAESHGKLGFWTSNAGTLSERMSIDYLGNVGIGTTSPTYPLTVAGTSAGIAIDRTGADSYLQLSSSGTIAGQLRYYDANVLSIASSGGIDRVVFDTSSGNVGIGTANPSSLLHLSATNPEFIIQAGSGGAATISLNGNNGTERGKLIMNDGGRFDISNNAITAISIDTEGEVGIGTQTPSATLHVYNATDITPDTGGSGQLKVEGNGYTGFIALDAAAMYVGQNSSSRRLDFMTNETTRMSISGSGDVGIGDTTPSEKLEIDGNIKLQGNDYIAMITSPSSGNGGYVQGTGEAGSNAGYGGWLNYNAVWNGTNWTQPRGDLGSYMFTSNYHLGWSWRYAAANGVSGATITPTEVAKITNTGAATFASLTLTTDLTVANGGTGASSFTNGGVLLGSGTGAITAMAVLSNGSIIVGDGATDPVALAAFTSSTGTLKHEYGGLEANVSAYTNGLYGMVSGVTTDIDTYSELNSVISDQTLATLGQYQNFTGQKDFSGVSVGAEYGINGMYSNNGGGTAYGATIWSIDTSYSGGAAGGTYQPDGVYGIVWQRSSAASSTSAIGEGLYVYQAGSRRGGIGTGGLSIGPSDNFTVNNSGVVTAGTWQGSAIASTYLDSSVILSTEIDTYAELNTLVSDVTLTHNGLIDTSAELAGIVTNETGSGSLVFGTSPSLTTPTIAGANISGTFTTTGATTIGDGGDTVTINTSSWDISSAGAVTGLTDVTASGTISGDALSLTDTTYTLKDGVRIFENVASYYDGNTTSSGTIAIELNGAPNMMIEAEVVIQGYNGVTECRIRGYTYTSTSAWHQPAATCTGSGSTDKQTVRFATSADGDRVILIGDTSSNWGNYPHITVPRVTYGYPASGSSIGTWTISILSSEVGYTNIASVNMNTGFTAYNSTLGGSVTLSGLSTGMVKSTSGLLSVATLGTDYINNSSIDTSAELAAILTNETGTGSAVFSASPTFSGTANFADIDASGSITSSNYFNLDAGNGNGVRFWNSDQYKISMGNTSEYQYGSVTDYSIKMGMSNTATRGWVWGVNGSTPVASISTQGHMQLAGNLTVVGQTLGNASDGTATPSFTWAGDTNTGMYRVADGNIGFATNGTVRWHIDATDMVYTVPARGANGSASAPAFSFSSDTNIGMYRGGTDILSFATAGLARMSINASGQVSIDTATNVADALTVKNSSASSVFAVSTLNTASSIFSVATSTGTSYFDVTATGNVGIGSTSPRSTLTVTGSACFSGGSGSTALCGTAAGSIYYRTASTGTYDVAENYVTSDLNLAPSTIVALDPSTGMTITTAMPGSIPLGIVSTDPGLTLGGADPNADMSVMRPVALSGRVPVKVSDANGPIMIGDRLMLSTSTPGVAVKAIRSGYTVGVALESYTGSGTGTIEAFVENQYYLAPNDLYIDSQTGRIGMGTQTPSHALQVAGDIGATGFVNTSTKAAKTDITYVTEEEAASMLETLENMQIAQYHYKIENKNNPLRLGLIAEEAPAEVLSADGKGVDIYKLATFTLAGVQELKKRTDLIVERLESLEERLAQLESGNITIGTGTPSISTTIIVAALKSFGVVLEEGFAKFQTLAALRFVAATDDNGQSSAGEGEILAGNTVVEIENEFVAPNSKIFITFTSALDGSWFIEDKEEGSFRVRLTKEQDEDVTFDYFIVQTDKEIEEEPEEEDEPIFVPAPEPTPEPETPAEPTPEPEAPVEVVDTNPAPEPTPEPEPAPAPEPAPSPAPESAPAPSGDGV